MNYFKNTLTVYEIFKSCLAKDKMEFNTNNKEIISRLKFLGRVKKGDKINTRHLFVQPKGLVTTFSRTLYNQDNRQNCLHFVQHTVDRILEIVTTFRDSETASAKFLYDLTIEDLQRAKVGIDNLKNTYLTDIKFCCDIDVILQTIDAILKEYNSPKSPWCITSPIETPSSKSSSSKSSSKSSSTPPINSTSSSPICITSRKKSV